MRAEDILPEEQNQAELNGVVIRKGTVAAFLANARVWSGQSLMRRYGRRPSATSWTHCPRCGR